MCGKKQAAACEIRQLISLGNGRVSKATLSCYAAASMTTHLSCLYGILAEDVLSFLGAPAHEESPPLRIFTSSPLKLGRMSTGTVLVLTGWDIPRMTGDSHILSQESCVGWPCGLWGGEGVKEGELNEIQTMTQPELPLTSRDCTHTSHLALVNTRNALTHLSPSWSMGRDEDLVVASVPRLRLTSVSWLPAVGEGSGCLSGGFLWLSLAVVGVARRR